MPAILYCLSITGILPVWKLWNWLFSKAVRSIWTWWQIENYVNWQFSSIVYLKEGILRIKNPLKHLQTSFEICIHKKLSRSVRDKKCVFWVETRKSKVHTALASSWMCQQFSVYWKKCAFWMIRSLGTVLWEEVEMNFSYCFGSVVFIILVHKHWVEVYFTGLLLCSLLNPTNYVTQMSGQTFVCCGTFWKRGESCFQ